MKALWIFYDIALDEEIMQVLDAYHIDNYTRWPRLTGKGSGSGARLDDHVWPGANAAIVIVQKRETIDTLMAALRTYRAHMKFATGLWAYTTTVLETLDTPLPNA